MNASRHFRALAGTLLLALPAAAQIPDTLLHPVPAPQVGVQSAAQLGFCVAVDGGRIVVGVPDDDIGATGAGVVKVFDASSGALLLVIPNPTPAAGEQFGNAVALSGTRLLVGAWREDTGAADAGSVYVYDLAGATPTVPALVLNNPAPAANDYFGVSVAVSGTRVAVGAFQDDSGADNSGSAYAYDLAGATPAVPVASFANPTPAINDFFGYAVAVAGNRVLVGSPQDDNGGSDSGMAYVYDVTSPTPGTPVLTLPNPAMTPSDEFGRAVALSGSRAVIGAMGDDPGASSAGSAHVYDLDGATPAVPVLTLNNPAPAAGDNFGHAVAVSGARVVVGAWLDNAGAADAGSAYAYDLGGATPTVPVAVLNNPAPAGSDQFGLAVAISGTRVVVGAPYDDTVAGDAGGAYVYELAGAMPSTPILTLLHSGPAPGDGFGSSVGVSGMRLIVGAPREDTGANNAGSAFVFHLSGPSPGVPALTLPNPSPAPGDQFGWAVAVSGTRAVVGAYLDDAGAVDTGTAHIYDLAGTTPAVPLHTLANPAPEFDDEFGIAVAISGTRVVVGAPYDNTGASDAGSAYVYDLTSGTPAVPLLTLPNPGPGTDERFGIAVAISGTRLAVGAPYDDTGAANAGSVYVYDLASATPAVPALILNNPDPAVNDYFGSALAVSGTRVVVGAYGDDTGASGAGRAYVYDTGGSTPATPVATLNNPSPASLDSFGAAVAISGAQVLIGVQEDDTGGSEAGIAYLYDLSSGTPASPAATLLNPRPSDGDTFGYAVALDAGIAAVGAPGEDSVMFDKGHAYVFGPDPDADNDGILDSWELTYWPTTAGHGPLDDHDKDGYPELLELALGLNPMLPDPAGLPAVTQEGGYLTLTITKQPGVTYQVQTAGTLLSAQPDSFSASSTTVLLDNAATLKARDNFLMSTSARRFIRAVVTAAP
jgi:hypothetical protein